MKISGKIYGLIFSTGITLVMSLSMSFFMLAINIGFVEDFLFIWMMNTLIGCAIGLPIAMITVPLLQKLMSKYFVVA